MPETQIYMVRRSHAVVMARQVNWEQVLSRFAKVVDEDTVEVPSTCYYGIDEANASAILTRKSVEEGIWMLGPYPDGGYWFVKDLSKYEVVQAPGVSLTIAAIRHLQRSVTRGDCLDHLSDIIDVNRLDPYSMDSICESLNFGDGLDIDFASYVGEVSIVDPDSKAPVELSIYKDRRSSGVFGIDCSYLETLSEDDPVREPFNGSYVMLIDGPYGSTQ